MKIASFTNCPQKRKQTIIQTTLMLVSFPIMYFLVIKCVKDTNYFSEATVIPPEYAGIQKSQAEAPEVELGTSS